jgi:hypothetical protein
MTIRFLMPACGERWRRCSAFLSARRKYQVVYAILVFCLSTVVVSPAQTFTTLAEFDGADHVSSNVENFV